MLASIRVPVWSQIRPPEAASSSCSRSGLTSFRLDSTSCLLAVRRCGSGGPVRIVRERSLGSRWATRRDANHGVVHLASLNARHRPRASPCASASLRARPAPGLRRSPQSVAEPHHQGLMLHRLAEGYDRQGRAWRDASRCSCGAARRGRDDRRRSHRPTRCPKRRITLQASSSEASGSSARRGISLTSMPASLSIWLAIEKSSCQFEFGWSGA